MSVKEGTRLESAIKWKYLLPYQSTGNIIAIADFWPPNVNEGSQNWYSTDAVTPLTVIAKELGECKKQPSATP